MSRAALAARAALLVALPPMCSPAVDAPADPVKVPGTIEVSGAGAAAPAPTLHAQPVSAFADAAPDDKPPFEQAKEYHARGQNWLARLLIEKRALSAEGSREEAELLLDICKAQGDQPCVGECGRKLGRKVSIDAGSPPALAPSAERPAETLFSRARDLHLKKKDKEARALLEPRVIDGKAPVEETRLLLEICAAQGDKMCVALCKKQLPGL